MNSTQNLNIGTFVNDKENNLPLLIIGLLLLL